MERRAALAAPAAAGAAGEPQRAPAPNEFVYGATIGACASAGRWEEAMRLLEQMASRGLPPPRGTRGSGFGAASTRRAMRARRLMREVLLVLL